MQQQPNPGPAEPEVMREAAELILAHSFAQGRGAQRIAAAMNAALEAGVDANIRITTARGGTLLPLLSAAASEGVAAETLTKVLQAGGDVGAGDPRGRTVWHVLAEGDERDDEETVLALLRAADGEREGEGAGIKQEDSRGVTALGGPVAPWTHGRTWSDERLNRWRCHDAKTSGSGHVTQIGAITPQARFERYRRCEGGSEGALVMLFEVAIIGGERDAPGWEDLGRETGNRLAQHGGEDVDWDRVVRAMTEPGAGVANAGSRALALGIARSESEPGLRNGFNTAGWQPALAGWVHGLVHAGSEHAGQARRWAQGFYPKRVPTHMRRAAACAGAIEAIEVGSIDGLSTALGMLSKWNDADAERLALLCACIEANERLSEDSGAAKSLVEHMLEEPSIRACVREVQVQKIPIPIPKADRRIRDPQQRLMKTLSTVMVWTAMQGREGPQGSESVLARALTRQRCDIIEAIAAVQEPMDGAQTAQWLRREGAGARIGTRWLIERLPGIGETLARQAKPGDRHTSAALRTALGPKLAWLCKDPASMRSARITAARQHGDSPEQQGRQTPAQQRNGEVAELRMQGWEDQGAEWELEVREILCGPILEAALEVGDDTLVAAIGAAAGKNAVTCAAQRMLDARERSTENKRFYDFGAHEGAGLGDAEVGATIPGPCAAALGIGTHEAPIDLYHNNEQVLACAGHIAGWKSRTGIDAGIIEASSTLCARDDGTPPDVDTVEKRLRLCGWDTAATERYRVVRIEPGVDPEGAKMIAQALAQLRDVDGDAGDSNTEFEQ